MGSNPLDPLILLLRLFFCNGKYQPTCETGWTADEACDVLARFSIPPEGRFPYKGAPNCAAVSSVADVRPSGAFTFKQINNLDVVRLRRHKCLGGQSGWARPAIQAGRVL